MFDLGCRQGELKKLKIEIDSKLKQGIPQSPFTTTNWLTEKKITTTTQKEKKPCRKFSLVSHSSEESSFGTRANNAVNQNKKLPIRPLWVTLCFKKPPNIFYPNKATNIYKNATASIFTKMSSHFFCYYLQNCHCIWIQQ